MVDLLFKLAFLPFQFFLLFFQEQSKHSKNFVHSRKRFILKEQQKDSNHSGDYANYVLKYLVKIYIEQQ